MNRKYLFTSMLIVGYLFTSCNERKNKIDEAKERDTIRVDLLAKHSQEKENQNIIHFESINVDSIIGNYRVLYKTQDNGRMITTYPITDGKGKDTICYASQDIILTINKNGRDIINRKIQRNDFRSFIPKNDISKYCISNFKIIDGTTSDIKFSINICIPETDICYWFDLMVSDNGDFKIKEVVEKESDM